MTLSKATVIDLSLFFSFSRKLLLTQTHQILNSSVSKHRNKTYIENSSLKSRRKTIIATMDNTSMQFYGI